MQARGGSAGNVSSLCAHAQIRMTELKEQLKCLNSVFLRICLHCITRSGTALLTRASPSVRRLAPPHQIPKALWYFPLRICFLGSRLSVEILIKFQILGCSRQLRGQRVTLASFACILHYPSSATKPELSVSNCLLTEIRNWGAFLFPNAALIPRFSVLHKCSDSLAKNMPKT